MKIEKGNVLLSVEKGIVVQGCNAQGRMNSGIAGEIHKRFPSVFNIYEQAFQKTGLELGSLTYAPPSEIENRGFWIANGIIQEHDGRDPNVVYADYNAIRNIFAQIRLKALELSVPVHYPKIGAGLANGDWEKIKNIIQEELQDVDHTLWVLE